MDRYYKIRRSSKTGKKLEEIMNRRDAFVEERSRFVEKYGIKEISWFNIDLCDVREVSFKTIPDNIRENWKHTEDRDFFTLKVNPKDKELKKDWERLRSMAVRRFEVDSALGGTDRFSFCGINFDHPEFFLIHTSEPDSYRFPKEVKEISNIEFEKLTEET